MSTQVREKQNACDYSSISYVSFFRASSLVNMNVNLVSFYIFLSITSGKKFLVLFLLSQRKTSARYIARLSLVTYTVKSRLHETRS